MVSPDSLCRGGRTGREGLLPALGEPWLTFVLLQQHRPGSGGVGICHYNLVWVEVRAPPLASAALGETSTTVLYFVFLEILTGVEK